jgi:hypothetical protein
MLVVAAADSSSGATIMKAKSAIIAAALLGPNPKQRLLLARDWATVRKSPDVDAYVLAWIASQVRFHSHNRSSSCGLLEERHTAVFPRTAEAASRQSCA